MKFSESLLALFVLQPGNAFLEVPQTSSWSSTCLRVARTPGDARNFFFGTINGRNESTEKTVANAQVANSQAANGQTVNGKVSSYGARVAENVAAIEQGQRTAARSSGMKTSPARRIMERSSPMQVQGGSLKTWSFLSPAVGQVHVVLKTEGRPLEADVQLWQGPDNTPEKMRVYVEDGSLRPFNALMETPRGPNTVSIRNIGQLEFPVTAYVVDARLIEDEYSVALATRSRTPDSSKTIQGGALRTYPFDPSVESVQIMLKTDGRPLNARIELLQGPNNNKQVIELYTEDGEDRPFYAVIETPGSGNVVRIVNTATVEFPLTAFVEPYQVGSARSLSEPVIGGDTRGFMGQWGR